jgi:hypothetical protein
MKCRSRRKLGEAIWWTKGDEFSVVLVRSEGWQCPKRVNAILESDESAVTRLNALTREDFTSGRTIVVQGWVLARSEAACAVALYMYSKQLLGKLK